MKKQNNEYSAPLQTWRNCAEVSIVQAALLMLDIEPQGLASKVENLSDDDQPIGYLAARQALESAVRSGGLEGELKPIDFTNVIGAPQDPFDALDYHSSFVMMADLKRWLGDIDHNCDLISKPTPEVDPWRDKKHERYSRKLSAAISAWEQYGEYADYSGTTKQKIERWLSENAIHLELINKDTGLPATSVIEEMAEIVNWDDGPGRRKKQK